MIRASHGFPMLAKFVQRNNDKIVKKEIHRHQNRYGTQRDDQQYDIRFKLCQTFRQSGLDQSGRDFTLNDAGISEDRVTAI